MKMAQPDGQLCNQCHLGYLSHKLDARGAAALEVCLYQIYPTVNDTLVTGMVPRGPNGPKKVIKLVPAENCPSVFP